MDGLTKEPGSYAIVTDLDHLAWQRVCVWDIGRPWTAIGSDTLCYNWQELQAHRGPLTLRWEGKE